MGYCLGCFLGYKDESCKYSKFFFFIFFVYIYDLIILKESKYCFLIKGDKEKI